MGIKVPSHYPSFGALGFLCSQGAIMGGWLRILAFLANLSLFSIYFIFPCSIADFIMYNFYNFTV